MECTEIFNILIKMSIIFISININLFICLSVYLTNNTLQVEHSNSLEDVHMKWFVVNNNIMHRPYVFLLSLGVLTWTIWRNIHCIPQK